MKKLVLNFLILSVLVSLISACSGSDADERFVKRWTLFKIDGVKTDAETNKVLGINNIYFDLRDDETFDARWYDPNSQTAFLDLKGTWITTDLGDKIDLFLFYGKGGKESKIFTVTKVDESVMVMRVSEIDHFFKAN